MQKVIQYRGTHHLDRSEVTRIVIQILRETPEAGEHDLAALERTAETLEEAGLGERKEDSAGAGYWRILALLCAMLLRIGGANMDAAANAVVGKSSSELEKLSEAILTRMRQNAGSKAAVKRLHVDSSAESAVSVQKERLVNTSSPGMLSPYASEPGTNNPAFLFLRNHTDDELRKKVRNLVLVPPPEPPAVSLSTPVWGMYDVDDGSEPTVDPMGSDSDSDSDSDAVTVAVGSTPFPASPLALRIADGVELSMTVAAVADYQSSAKRAGLLRRIATAVDSYYAGDE